MIPTPIPAEEPLVDLVRPMAGLVFHYNKAETAICETTGMVETNSRVSDILQGILDTNLKKVVVLVSPTYYQQRKHFYGSDPKYRVLPLLFKWSKLTAVQLKKLMKLDDRDNQLYVGLMLSKLRGYQRRGELPPFDRFCKEMLDEVESKSQEGPLRQRIAVLEQFVLESQSEADRLEQEDLANLMESGTLVVCDLTDPMLSPVDANGVFQVLLEQFRLKKLDCGKIVVCDEAHKYFGASSSSDGFSSVIVETARTMRHEGMRLVISSQSPLSMPSELLELSSIVLCHSFHSKDWWDYLKAKIPLPADGFEEVLKLRPGDAFLFSSKAKFEATRIGGQVVKIRVRERLTQDRGRSITNTALSHCATALPDPYLAWSSSDEASLEEASSEEITSQDDSYVGYVRPAERKNYIYVCSNETRKECFERQMFGDNKERDTKLGDTLFLYNYKRREFEGPFKAASDSSVNLVEDAWDGRFPHQVRVMPLLDESGANLALNARRVFARVHKAVFQDKVRMDKASNAVPEKLTPEEGRRMLNVCVESGGWDMTSEELRAISLLL